MWRLDAVAFYFIFITRILYFIFLILFAVFGFFMAWHWHLLMPMLAILCRSVVVFYDQPPFCIVCADVGNDRRRWIDVKQATSEANKQTTKDRNTNIYIQKYIVIYIDLLHACAACWHTFSSDCFLCSTQLLQLC